MNKRVKQVLTTIVAALWVGVLCASTGDDGLRVMLSADTGHRVVSESDDVALTRLTRLERGEQSMAAARTAQALPQAGERTIYAFFPDAVYTVTVTRVTAAYGGAHLIEGTCGENIHARFQSVVTRDGVRHEVHDFTRGKLYQAAGRADDVLELREYDDTKRPAKRDAAFPATAANTSLRENSPTGVAGNVAADSSGIVIDLMLVFDTTAQSWSATRGGVNAVATAAVGKMNLVLANSGIDDCTFRLVHVLQADYTSSGDLYRDLLTLSGSSGSLTAMRSLRNTYGADLISMVVDTGSAYGTTGMGYYPASARGDPSAAFTVCSIRSVNISHTLTHEIGHNLGCGHSKFQRDTPGPSSAFPYAAGWYLTGNHGVRYHTIMAYDFDGYGASYNEIDYFSTPLKTYQNTGLGHVTDGDNARAFSAMAPIVAAYRGVVPDRVTTPRFAPPHGATFSKTLTVNITCATPDATLHYTTDDSEPTTASAQYAGPITLWQTTTIKSKAFKTGMTASATATAVYTRLVSLVDALDAPGLTWGDVSSVLPWFGQSTTTYDGVDAAQSGPIDNGQTSSLQTVLTGPGTLSFHWRVSSEAGWDSLRVTVNDIAPLAPISGETPWQRHTIALDVGTHTVRWEYVKDASYSAGNDCGWLDQVVWEPLIALRVVLDAQGGTVAPASTIVTANKPYGVLPTPQREGFTFDGWYADPSLSGEMLTPETTVTAAFDHTLYAKWEPWGGGAFLCDPRGDLALQDTGSYDGFFYSVRAFATRTPTAVQGTLALKLAHVDGKLTVKAALPSGTLSLRATAWSEHEADGTRRATLTARTGETLDLFVRQNRIWGTLTGGKVGDTTLVLDGGRNRFADRSDAAAAALREQFRGYYTVALPPREAISASAEIDAAPQGAGYLAITVGSRGSAKIAGILADGTRVSRSSRLILFEGCGEMACVPLFASLYTKRGWVGGLLWLSPQGVVVTDRANDWFVHWENPGKGADGFDLLLDACGGFYSPTTALAASYRLTVDAAPTYWCAEGAVSPAAVPTAVPVAVAGTRMTLDRSAKPRKVTTDGVTTYEYDAVNPANVRLSFAARSGIFKGTFSLYYDYEAADRLQHKTLRATYGGILVPLRDAEFADLPAGLGYSLVPDTSPAAAPYRLKRSHALRFDAE